ncbi:MAG: retroviral-like aspartic protease family protein [Scytonematopsis contorta HA4267-MV1]|jgi:predicted aspartyl protease|nr:retroviral-like aspartic protease family protein [Scytonematopsis contorta HA4267-MV1]
MLLHPTFSRASLIFLATTLAVAGAGCRQDDKSTAVVNSSPDSSPIKANVTPGKTTLTVPPAVKQFTPKSENSIERSIELGLDKANGAFSISQSALSTEDWQLVAMMYQEATVLMKQVPNTSPYFAIAQTKIQDYQRQIKYAERKASLPSSVQSPPELQAKRQVESRLKLQLQPQLEQQPQKVVIGVQKAKLKQIDPKIVPPHPPIIQAKLPAKRNASRFDVSVSQDDSQPELPKAKAEVVFTANIKRRVGGTPVIEVTFNGNQTFDMIVDTGASGTVITQKMAQAMGVVTVGKAKANTASAKSVEFPIGYVESMEIDGAKVNRVPVAIAGLELETGLLGHDFFGNYDVTIKRDVVEFRPHSDA